MRISLKGITRVQRHIKETRLEKHMLLFGSAAIKQMRAFVIGPGSGQQSGNLYFLGKMCADFCIIHHNEVETGTSKALD